MGEMPGTTRSDARRRRWASLAAVLLMLSTAATGGEARAQSSYGDTPIRPQQPMPDRPRGGGGGVGVGAAIGLGLGLLGAAAAARAASEEEPPPPRRGREPPRVRVVDPDGAPVTKSRPRRSTAGSDTPSNVRPKRSAGETPPKTPKRSTARDDGPAVRIPPPGETRFLAGEVLVEMRGDRSIEPLARRLGLEVLGTTRVALNDRTLHRLRARDGRATTEVLQRLRRERTVASAQPNWIYTLQQVAAAPEAAAPAAADTTAVAAPGTEAPTAAGSAAPTSGDGVAAPAVATGAEAGVPSQVDRPAASSATAVPTVEAGTTAPVSEPIATSSSAVEPVAAPPTEPETAAARAAPALGPLPGQYGAEKLRLAAAQSRSRGAGVRIAVIDTGVDADHPELAGAIEAQFDALSGVDPAPGLHGTAMAGAVAARLRLAGAAPAARLLTARAFGPPGANGVAQGSTYDVVRCLDWAVGQGARVVSMSFAGPSNALLARTLAAAEQKGVIAVAAAGNAGPQSPPLFPGADPGVIAVTASDAEDRVLPAANRGGYVAVTAPGVDILVAAPHDAYDLTTGTSVAAAEVSGVVALMLARQPKLKPDDVRRILVETAIDLGPKGRDPIFGAGLVDAEAAVGSAGRRSR